MHESPGQQTKCAFTGPSVGIVNDRRRTRMTTGDRLTRLGSLSGVLFVVLELAGVAVGEAGGRSMAALGDPTSKILETFSGDVGTGVWVGAYMELAAMAAFAVFAAWLF